nr:reverse transcriptase domain-containing protein [Tanacetum cinerariifolium]
MKHSYSNDDTCFSIDDEILKEDFDALLDKGSKILHSIEGTLLEEEFFFEYNEFIAMAGDENFESESVTKEPPFEKNTINTDYKIKTSLEKSPTDLKLKPLLDNLEYVFLEELSFLPKTIDIPGICPSFSKHEIRLLDDKKPVVQKQRSPIHCVPKKGGIIVVTNKNDELVPTRTVTGWRVCIDYRRLNEAIVKDHFPLPFMDQISRKTTFTCPFRTYAYRRMPFELCNAPTTFQRCMLAIFHDMIEESVEVFMDDFSVFGDSFNKCLYNLDKMLQRCKDTHLVLKWKKCNFMVKEGIVLRHKVSSTGLEVYNAKIDVISKLPSPTNVKDAEAQALPTNDARVVVTFLKKLFCRFRMPKALISDRDKFVRDPNKTPNSSQRPPHDFLKYGKPVDGRYCRQCALLRKKLKEVWFTIYDEHKFFQDFLNTSESSNDNTNITISSVDDVLLSLVGTVLILAIIVRRKDENSLAHDLTPNFVNDSHNVFNPPPQPPTYSYEFCGNDAHYSHDCPPQVLFIYNSESCYNKDFNFPQNFQNVQQQYPCCKRCGGPHKNFQCQQVIFYEPCCENYGGPHETFQCQPMNYYEPNLCYESNYPGFDQSQPLQFPVIHQPPQETSVEILHHHENVINSVQTFLRKFNHFSFFKTPKVLLRAWDRISEIKNAFGNKQYKPEDMQELIQKLFNDVQNIHEELAEYINIPSWNRPAFSNYDDEDDDKDYTIAITPEEPDNSLSMGDENLDTIPAMKSDEVIKSSVEDLVSIPSESEGIPDNTCDVPFRDNSSPLDVSKDQFKDFSDSKDESTSIDDDYFSIDNIDYVEASPPDSELVSSEEVEDDNLCEKLLNINLLIAKIKSLNDNPTPDRVLKSPSLFPIPVEDSDSFLEKSDTSLSYSDNSLPEFETFSDHTEETSSGSTTTHADYSLPKYDLFLFKIEPDQGELTSVVMEDNLGEPRVHVPNVLPTHPTLMLDSNFIPSDISLPESKIFYFDIEEKNSGSTTIHVDMSLSDLECFNFKSEPDPGELKSIVDSEIRENVLPTTNVNLSPEDDQSPLFAYVSWIFISFLTYPGVPPYLLSSVNKDTMFDPGISIYHSFKPDVSHWCGTFIKFNVYPNLLNESPMEILSSTCSPMDQ